MSKFIVDKETCPLCGSHMVTYGGSDLYDEGISYEAQCDDCGATWTEDYAFKFAGVSKVHNKEGKEVAGAIDVGGENVQ